MGFDSQLIEGLYQHTDVVRQYLTENFVDLGGGALGFHRSAELGLNHRHAGLRIRPLVIVGQEGFPVEVVVMPRTAPKAVEFVVPLSRCRVGLKRDVSSTADRLDRTKVALAGVRLISGNLANGVECLSGCCQQVGQLRSVRRFPRRAMGRSNDMGSGAAHEVGFGPDLLGLCLAPLVVKPPVVSGCGEPRAVDCKLSFHGCQRASTGFNQRLQDGSQRRVGKVSVRGVEVWGMVNETIPQRSLNVAREPAGRESAVNGLDRRYYRCLCMSLWRP